ncbi:MAG: glycosyltransferase family 9 protein [Burkholderiales bacterium]
MLKIDCHQYRGDRPCAPHKRDGRSCDGCDEYRPIVDRLLIIKLGALGDVLRTTSLLPALFRVYESPHVTWITRRSAAPLLAGNRYVSRVLTVEGPHLEHLLVERFTAGFGLDSEALPASMLAISRCDRYYGFRADDRGRLVPAGREAEAWWLMGLDDARKRANRQTYQSLLYEMCAVPGPVARPMLTIATPARARASALLAVSPVLDGRPVVGLNTGGGSRWQYKKWTTVGWMSLLEQLRDDPMEPALVLLGGPQEAELNALLASRFGERVIFAGCHHDLMTFAALVERADVLVTADSLALHMATALCRPVVALVGPTSPWELELYGQGEALTGDVDCIACYRTTCDKRPACMDLLSATRVASAVRRWLPSTAAVVPRAAPQAIDVRVRA